MECKQGLSGCNYLRSVQRVYPILQEQEQGQLSLDLLLWLPVGFQEASTLPLFSAWPAYFIRITSNHCVKWCSEVFLSPLVCYYLLRYDATEWTSWTTGCKTFVIFRHIQWGVFFLHPYYTRPPRKGGICIIWLSLFLSHEEWRQ